MMLAGAARADLPAPNAARVPHARTLHGVTDDDPWFWLRQKGSKRVAEHLRAESDYAAALMKPAAALQESLYREMVGRLQEDDSSAPYQFGNYIYYFRNEKGKEHDIHCRRRVPDGKEEIFLDLNAVKKKFVDVGQFEPSDDDRRIAYNLDTSGFREYSLLVKDLRTGAHGPERIPRVTSFAWAADGKTLFYVVENSAKRPHRLYRHTLGAKNDALIYEEKDGRFNLVVQRSSSRRLLLLSAVSLTQTEVRLLAADRPTGEWRVIAPRRASHEYYADHRGGELYIRTNDRGRNFRVVTAPVDDPGEARWKERVPHRATLLLQDHQVFANHLLLYGMEAGLPQIEIVDLRSDAMHRVRFPETVYFATPHDNHVFETATIRFNYQSFTTPQSDFDYDVETRERRLIKRKAVLGGYDPDAYQAERLSAPIAEGVAVPISVVRKKGVPLDGRAPMLLEGYGSYGWPFPIAFEPERVSLLDRGVILAVAHVRGGGELGKPWHDDGRMLKKRNTFTDFIRCAEFLVEKKFSSSDRLAIAGTSAGGLLVGAVINLRPELFRAAIAHVPFVDVINTMLDEKLPLTVEEFEEWGNPRNKDEFDYMRGYSPYDNVTKKNYPALLVTSSLNDSQVMYWEPAKWVAKLRALKTDVRPIVFRINLEPAGHGGRSGRYEQLRETAFDYAWLLGELGVAQR